MFFLALSLSAADLPERGWTIGPSVGVHWGTAYEIVYDTANTPNNQNDYLSLLIWDLKPAVMVGFESLWESGKGNSLDIKLRSAIPGMPVGEMHDFDWLYTDRDWSHWSVSDVNLRWGILLDAVHDWRVVNRSVFALKLGVGYHLDWWAWRDTVKDSIYSTTDSGTYPRPFDRPPNEFRDIPDAIPVGVNGIYYEVAYHVPLLSLTADFEWKTMFLLVNGRIGPVLAFSHDHHKLRTDLGPDGGHFYDTAFGGPWIDATLAGGLQTSGRFSFTLRGEYAWLKETRGDTVIVRTDGTGSGIAKGAGGFSFRRIGVTALFSWTLDRYPKDTDIPNRQ